MNHLKSRGRVLLVLLTLLAGLALLVPASYAEPAQPPDAALVQQQMQQLVDWLDSPAYAQVVTWHEHLVLVYRLAQGRDPTPVEFFLLTALRDDIGFTRSAALSVALRGPEASPTWQQCRSFLQRANASDFRARYTVTEVARRLAAIPRTRIMDMASQMAAAAENSSPAPQPPAPAPVANVQYNTYFGYMHAHSDLSDGSGTPLEAYTYARDVGQLDFFALTDHGELLMLWPWEHNWEELIAAAEATYQPGSYATLWGFEWSNPLLGHVNVVNSADYTTCVSNIWITRLYDWLVERPDAFGCFDHPGDYDFLSIELLHLKLYTPAVPQMVGIENWNGTESFDKYYYSGSWSNSYYSYWDVGNLKGWYLGSLGGQDNHGLDWGTRNDFRTAVLAEGLTREQIADAYRNRRFYATEDKDLTLDLRCQGYPMGSRLEGVPRIFTVSACDGSGDTFQEVRLYRNGNLLRTKAVSGTCFQAAFADLGRTGADYYYVIVRQNDDNDANGRNDEAISSPIWIQ